MLNRGTLQANVHQEGHGEGSVHRAGALFPMVERKAFRAVGGKVEDLAAGQAER